MELAEILQLYNGQLIDKGKLSNYQQWALDFFHQSDAVANPYINTTIQLNITEAMNHYQSGFTGGTKTAYLKWCLLQTLNECPEFNYRKIKNEWYLFHNLPLFFPVATANSERFTEVLLENVRSMNWIEFFQAYTSAIESAKSTNRYQPLDSQKWLIADFIGNLPYLQFSSFTIHRAKQQTGRPYFYFGKRYSANDNHFCPLAISFDHANTDPWVLNLLIEKYMQNLTTA